MENKMNKNIVKTLALIAIFWVVQVQAVTLTQWGTYAGASSADCTILDCSKFGFLFNPIIPGAVVGGLNQTSAELLGDVNPDGRGTISASVELQGGLSIPILKAKAESVDDDGWVSGLAMGVQGYQFTGVDGTTVKLDTALTGDITNTSASDVTGLSVGVWLFAGDSGFVFPNPPASMGDLLLQVLLLPVVDSFSWEDTDTGNVNRSTTTTDQLDQLSFTLNHGDEFYLLAGLTAAADGSGAIADAFSTLEMKFNTTQLTPANVPLPAGLWLLGGALVWLFGLTKLLRTGNNC